MAADLLARRCGCRGRRSGPCPARGRVEPEQRVHQGRLAGAVGPEQADGAARERAAQVLAGSGARPKRTPRPSSSMTALIASAVYAQRGSRSRPAASFLAPPRPTNSCTLSRLSRLKESRQAGRQDAPLAGVDEDDAVRLAVGQGQAGPRSCEPRPPSSCSHLGARARRGPVAQLGQRAQHRPQVLVDAPRRS